MLRLLDDSDVVDYAIILRETRTDPAFAIDVLNAKRLYRRNDFSFSKSEGYLMTFRRLPLF